MKTDTFLDKCFYIIGWILIGLTAAVVIVIRLGVFDRFGGLPPCLLHSTTGLYCPGCGGTRAVYALLHGRILRSLFYHPIVGYTAFLGGWFMISQTVERLSQGKLAIGMHFREIYLWLALAIVVLNCLIKNLVLIVGGVALMG